MVISSSFTDGPTCLNGKIIPLLSILMELHFSGARRGGNPVVSYYDDSTDVRVRNTLQAPSLR
jgi:hypothetical protein